MWRKEIIVCLRINKGIFKKSSFSDVPTRFAVEKPAYCQLRDRRVKQLM